MTNLTDTQAAVDAGMRSASAPSRVTWIEHPLDSKIRVPLVIDADGLSVPVDALAELDSRYSLRPRAVSATLTEVDSFIAYLRRWGSDRTVVYADTADLELHAVLDDYPASSGGQSARSHRASYACPRSPSWIAWSGIDSKPQSQTQFADFIESKLEDMVVATGMPAPMDVLQMARHLSILTKGTYQRELNPVNGDSIFIAKTETDTKSTEIPRAFMLGIQVFDGGDRYEVEARVRFQLVDGRPSFTVALHRRSEIERDAFAAVRGKVAKESSLLVLAGTP